MTKDQKLKTITRRNGCNYYYWRWGGYKSWRYDSSFWQIPRVSNSLKVMLVWMDEEPMIPEKNYEG